MPDLPVLVNDFSSTALAKLKSIVQGAGKGPGAGTGKGSGSDLDKTLKDGLRRLEGTLSRGLGATTGLAAAGFRGTAQATQLSWEMDRVSRQMAAVFAPVVQAMTYAASKLANGLANLDLTGQNKLMGTVLGASVGRLVGGLPGMLIGGAIGGAVLGGRDTNTTLTGAASGAYLGFRAGGPIGAVIGGGIGAVAGSPDSYRGERPFDYYSRLRAGGASRFGAGLSVLGETPSALFDPSGRPERPPPPGPRRPAPLAFSSAEEEAGGGARRAQEIIARMRPDGTISEDAGPLKPIVDALLMIIQLLGKIAGVSISFDSPSDARMARTPAGGP